MGKSLEQVTILSNPDFRYWSQILQPMVDTEDWAFVDEDYTTWKNSFEKFWLFTAVEKDTDETVGCITLAFDRSISGKEDEELYYVGMFYVREEWRGSGVGVALFDKVMEIAHGSNMTLHGVLKMSQKYATKYGFDKMPDYKHVFASVPTEHLVIPEPDHSYILKDLKDVDESKLETYDAEICHRSRANYLRNFMSTKDCYVKVALDQSGKIVGFCNVRSTIANTLCTGPLYADNEAIAKSLLAGVLSMIKDIKKYRYIASLFPDINKEAHDLFQSLGGGHTKIAPFTQCAFTKKVLPIPEQKVFGVIECANSFV
ncbi:unnamed protein product [Cylicocyclus nassatus]|uniref:N-acetyltransferase domain-containing protein n=1 Tax=Cylicocyclus nassatus TaxID=53992 RepID=A0AA36DKM6_CYLNA|nr:unnamed protein product [Cylicocyclus nassatus]